jgi:hypothetical protein
MLNEFAELFPFVFGGTWNSQLLLKDTRKHLWIPKGDAFPELQNMSNSDYRTKYGRPNWTDAKIELLRKALREECLICKRVRQQPNYEGGKVTLVQSRM